MTSSVTMRGARPLTGRTVLFGMIAFFAIVAAVNAVFIYFAIASWPGLSSPTAYTEGLRYNGIIEQAQRQRELGWQGSFERDTAGVATFHVLDSRGGPVNGLRVEVAMSRPLGNPDQTTVALPQVLDGSYRAPMPALAAGQWRAQVMASRGDETLYRMDYDIWVRP